MAMRAREAVLSCDATVTETGRAGEPGEQRRLSSDACTRGHALIALDRSEHLCLLVPQLEVALERLGRAIPTHDPSGDDLMRVAAELGPLGLDVIRIGCALIDSASVYATLARLERDAVPDSEVDHAP